MRFETSRAGLAEFLTSSSEKKVDLTKIKSPGLKGDWQEIPEGVLIESGTYVNTVGGCSNTIDVDVQTPPADSVRAYITMDCAS
ncbi:hypothetical protein [Streptomyces atratus]|uniref:hypothetical protein n=1 Tax=Streptomyces atratus TaxID=1893 RepID=UPI0033F15BBA